MKKYLAYIRVSTVKQGQLGSSLQEQRDAIEAFALRNKLTISEWFEDRETAAKKGRTQFVKMMNRLEKRHAAGVLLHKIDRGARNLWDWARIQNLLDAGLEVHFVHDNLDMASRGGRLAADIQAVVAADYVRNLRDEVRKGIRGRLKQGLYPLSAPLGYLNNGKAKPKTIDPLKGPLVRLAFELYASNRYTFHSLRAELQRQGLTRRDGKALSLCSITAMLRNPFYSGVIRLKVTGETYPGVHEPLISPALYRRVQEILDGRLSKRPNKHDFLYRRLFTCGSCSNALIGERQKGHVYYRCHTPTCSTTGVREETISSKLREIMAPLRFSDDDIESLVPMIKEEEKAWTASRADRVRAANLRISALEDRERRLTDAYLDGAITLETYQTRRGTLVLELAEARESHLQLARKDDEITRRGKTFFDLTKAVDLDVANSDMNKFREVLRCITSNCSLVGKNLCITLQTPFDRLASDLVFLRCALHRDAPRTFEEENTSGGVNRFRSEDHYHQVVKVLATHLKDWEPPAGFVMPEATRKKPLNWRKHLRHQKPHNRKVTENDVHGPPGWNGPSSMFLDL